MPFNITNAEPNSLVSGGAYDISSFSQTIQENLSTALVALLTSEVVTSELTKHVDILVNALSSYLPKTSSIEQAGSSNATIARIKKIQELSQQIEKNTITIEEKQATALAKEAQKFADYRKEQRAEKRLQKETEKAGQERNALMRNVNAELSYLETQNIYAQVNIENLIEEGKISQALEEITKYTTDFSKFKALSQDACYKIKTEALDSLAGRALEAWQQNAHNIEKRADYDEYKSSTTISATATSTVAPIPSVTTTPTQIVTTTTFFPAQNGTIQANTTMEMTMTHSNAAIGTTSTIVNYSSTGGNATVTFSDGKKSSLALGNAAVAGIALGGTTAIIAVAAVVKYAKEHNTKVHPHEQGQVLPVAVVVATPTSKPSLVSQLRDRVSTLFSRAEQKTDNDPAQRM